MHHFEFLGDLVLIAAVALGVVLLFQKIKLPPVVGLIATGVLLGQSGFRIIENNAVISTLAELGVVLLLFAIGLEFSVDELKRLQKIVWLGGALQVVLTSVSVGIVAFFLLNMLGEPISVQTAIFLGLALAVSSTAICLKVLTDRDELSLPQGRIALGILIFQDIAIVPMMIAVSFLAPNSDGTWVKILRELGLLGVFAIGIIGGFRVLMPNLARLFASTPSKEVLALGALLLCFGSAYISSLAGLSLALGAFVAGIMISSTDESHKIAGSIEPLRDALTSIFFISVGLLLNISPTKLPLYLTLAAAVLIVNAALATVVGLLLGYSPRISLTAGIILSQVGEFSFLLASAGKMNAVINEDIYQGLLAVIVVTMIVAPLLIAFAPRVADRIAPALEFIPLRRDGSHPEADALAAQEAHQPSFAHVVIIGFGTNGRNIDSVLKATHVSHVILDNDRAVVDAAKRSGMTNIFYGDGADKHTLAKIGTKTANAVVIGISDKSAVLNCIARVRELNSDAYIIVRTRELADIEPLYAAGASTVVTEKFETSIQIFSLLLQHFKLPTEMVLEQQDIIRRELYKVFPKYLSATEKKASSL